jgi:two-component system, cell cycle sensor histidine kinase and response regulator CckA
VIRDISAANLAAHQLRESEERFRSYFNLPLIGFAITSPTKGWVAVNDRLCQYFGYSREELDQTDWAKLTYPDDLAADLRQFHRMLAGEIESYSLEKRFVRKDKAVVWAHIAVGCVRKADGTVDLVCGCLQDITDRKNEEERRRKAEAEYRALFERATEGIFRSSLDGRYLTVNPAWAKILGYDSPEDLVSSVTDLSRQVWNDPDDRQQYLKKLQEDGVIYGYESQLKRKDGSKIWVSQNTRAVRDCDGRTLYYEGFVEDITERKQLEEQFLQAQKLEAVGRLAGGVAHDFNNLLGVITGFTDLTLEDGNFDERTKRRLGDIKKAANRAVEVTRQLLAFSRKQVLQTQALNLNPVVEDAARMLARLLGEDIRLVVSLDPEVGWVNADPTSIEQILMNLAVNARDAMPHGGNLTIQTANILFREVQSETQMQIPPGDYVMLIVSDTGTGIMEEYKQHIFEPFFTTKEIGQGTGLGLSTVYGIVQQSGGFISFDTELGRGTEFKIYLPRIAAAITDSVQEGPETIPRGSETILLVEDDPSLRAFDVELLEDLGYKVIEAANAAEAIAAADQLSEPLHVLMTDVIMPGLNGRQLAERLLETRPTLKVLYVSGYSDNIVQKAILVGGAAFLQKPVSLSDLATKLRQVLEVKAHTRSVQTT